jgi:cytochrome c oxidase assembly protein subunit 15
MQNQTSISTEDSRPVAYWLWLVCTLIVIMVAVGGITRLTGSGLSIADWNPIMGAIPPRNEAQWQQAFDLYKQNATAQYEQFSRNLGEMTLPDFQEIYFWEYIHRLLGRFIGLAYAGPMIWFWVKGRVKGTLRWKLLLGLILGGGQGFLGWFMVRSGFADLPRVSHFRLAAHLSMALLLYSYLLWIVLDLNPFWARRETAGPTPARLRKYSLIFLALLSFQIVYGAFTAGLQAGHMYNTYPLMGGRLFPDTRWNIFTNPAAVQFMHRHLGLVVLAALIALWRLARTYTLSDRQKLAFNLLLACGILQFFLGVYTLVSGVQIHVAVSHQVMACLLLGSAVLVIHELMHIRPRPAGLY